MSGRPTPGRGGATFRSIAPLVVGMLLGGALVAWIVCLVAVRAGGYYPGAVSRSGTARVDQCRTTVLFTTSCSAQVTWTDGTTERVRVVASDPVAGSVPVAKHPRIRYGRGPRSAPVVLTTDFPSGRHTGVWSAALFVLPVAGGISGAFVAAKIQARMRRRRRTDTD